MNPHTSVQTFDSRSDDAYSDLFDELFPICRSITGPGLRQSLRIFAKYMPLAIGGTPSGREVFDWTVPEEWAIESAELVGPDGQSVCSFTESNLCVVNYSVPVDATLTLDDLRPHLHGIPASPKLTPYVTSYYRDAWGFCLPQETIDSLAPGLYRARIVSRKYPGEVNFGTALLPGENKHEAMITSYLCHPSMANNELSGPLVLLGLYDRLSRWKRRRFSYRFVLAPETIGSLCVLDRYGKHFAENMIAGLVLTCLGGPNTTLSYKTSRRENTVLDRLMASVANADPATVSIRHFTPIGGSDERQYCSPGFNLPVGQIARTIYGEYAEYHTSGDDKAFMGIDQIKDAVDRIERLLLLHEYAGIFVNTTPCGEPQLGKRGLYPNMNSPTKWNLSNDTTLDGRVLLEQMLFLLNYSDGTHSVLDIAAKSGYAVADFMPAVDRLEAAGLLQFTGLPCQ